MCGICGIINFSGKPIEPQILSSMNNTLMHRGPDDEGYFFDNTAGASCGFGHRRLSIIDLYTGKQPIHNEDQTIWIVYNGEIYNFQELRHDLEKQGHKFYTKTDTEVIVHLYEQLGPECLEKLRGMFSFAIWDKKQKQLFLARDRIGKKPLNYYVDQNRLIFASETKAILKAENIIPELDLEAMHYYLTYQYVPAPYTMFKNIKKLLPAHYLIWNKSGLVIKKYWQVNFSDKINITEQDAAGQLMEQLKEATRLRLVSDVPLGVFLSGGMDSSAVVALMHLLKAPSIETFSIGFAEREYNELPYARQVAKLFNCKHHALLIKPKMLEILPKLIWHYNEPFGDYSCIPTYYVALMAKEYVKVVLTGDGGDESFAGYQRYAVFKQTKFLDLIPVFLRKALGTSYKILPNSPEMRSFFWQLKRFLKFMPYPDVRRYGGWMCCFDEDEKNSLYHNNITSALRNIDPLKLLENIYNKSHAQGLIDKIIATDILTYLPDDLLVKTDIATMANSLEARSPFLDHKIIEFGATVPENLKLNNTISKFILKQAFKHILPREILNRNKKGFGIPMGQWFRTDLKKYLTETLYSSKLIQDNILNKQFIDNIINVHMSGSEDYGYKLWNLLNLELWYDTFIKS